ncbi:MAG: NAD kinase [Bacteroidota bacterium]
MHIALFGRRFNPEFFPVIQKMVTTMENHKVDFIVYDKFFDFLKGNIRFQNNTKVFENHHQLTTSVSCMISLGGDGTLLDTLPLIRNSGIPVLGINTGRLGFLSSVSTDEMESSVKEILEKKYQVEQRSLLYLDSGPAKLFEAFPFALNEVTLIKRDNTTMIAISAFVNGKYLNTYWADGLMVATPTGSTGYSLSCGGPIISPDSENFIITPIASHNLTVRPIVIKDDSLIKFRIEGRIQSHLIVMDSRTLPLEKSMDLFIKKADYKINLINTGEKDFFTTIRNKLAWGFDKRN